MREFWIAAGQIMGLLMLGVFLVYAERLKAWMWRRWDQRALNPIARAVQTCRVVHECLVELRVKIEADRAYVCQFHNGDYFTSKNPVYRMSCTQEIVLRGIARRQDKLQGVMVDTIWREIDILFGEATLEGVERIWDDGDETKPYRAVYYYLVEALPESTFKSALIASGVWAMAASPMLDAKRNLVGFVGCDFCSEQYRDGTKRPHTDDLQKVSHAAANVWYSLEQHLKR